MIGPIALMPLSEQQNLSLRAAAAADFGAPEWLLVAAAVAAFLFLIRQTHRRRADRPPRQGVRTGSQSKPFWPQREKHWILVDGSNVMHWEDNTPQIAPVRRVVTALKAQGFDPGVVFDANVGWKLVGRHLGERELGQILDLPPDQVLVVPKGSAPDPWLLTTAKDFRARIVTNGRFLDWEEAHPEVAEPGFLVRGGLSGDGVWLEGLEPPNDRTGN